MTPFHWKFDKKPPKNAKPNPITSNPTYQKLTQKIPWAKWKMPFPKSRKQKMQSRTSGQHHHNNQINLATEIRRQNRLKRQKKWAIFGGMLAVALFYALGGFQVLLSQGRSLYESANIAFAEQSGFPVQTSISNLYQVEPLSGGFVALGAEGCVVYSAGGNRLNSMQTGYARPAIAVGETGYVLYQRSGRELRVESRTETQYTKTYQNNLLLASMSSNGSVSVLTESDRHLATLTMYNANMRTLLTYDVSANEGIPLCMEYATDNKTLALASISTTGGQMFTRITTLDTKGNTVLVGTQTGALPLAITWLSNQELLVAYDTMMVQYHLKTQENTILFEDDTASVVDYTLKGNKLAVLLSHGTGQNADVLLFDKKGTLETSFAVPCANAIAWSTSGLHLVYDREITTYSTKGEQLHVMESDKKILSLVQAKEWLIFTDNETTVFDLPMT